jgi:hypothetical protein
MLYSDFPTEENSLMGSQSSHLFEPVALSMQKFDCGPDVMIASAGAADEQMLEPSSRRSGI